MIEPLLYAKVTFTVPVLIGTEGPNKAMCLALQRMAQDFLANRGNLTQAARSGGWSAEFVYDQSEWYQPRLWDTT